MLIRSLEIFRAVVDTGSFSAAAERSHTVQSNVTAHIKKLEAELGVCLLHRRTPVTPTPAGRQLLGYACRIVDLHDQARDRFRSDGEPGGELRLGSMETTAAVHLPAMLTAFSERWPEIAVQLRTGTSADLLEELRAGRLDAVFVAATEVGGDLLARPVFRERLVLVSGRPMKAFPDARTLAGSAFLAFRQGCGYRHAIEKMLAARHLAAPRIHELGSLDAIAGCVSAGMGLALLPESVVAQYRERYRLYSLRLPDEFAESTTVLATTTRASWSRALEVFMDGPGRAAA